MAFNRHRWQAVMNDEALARLPYRIETNAHGQIIMNPPPSGGHSHRQTRIILLLSEALGGMPLAECPISTIDGVKAADVGWYSDETYEQVRGQDVFERAPEICVEVISPSNAASEMLEKKSLYFEAGASEVWYCREDGTMEFYDGSEPGVPRDKSPMCRDFPERID